MMLHSNVNDGSTWQITEVKQITGRSLTFSISSVLCHHGQLNLHVRDTWKSLNEEDTLMLSSSLSPGSHWEIIPGPVPGTSLLRNVRSDCYLRIRPAWATESKGSHLALSLPGLDPADAPATSFWCCDPAPAPAGAFLLRSATAIVRSPRPKQAGPGRKFAQGGAWLPQAGWSVVADVLPAARVILAPGRKLVEESAAGRTLYSATLPLESLHMTVCGFDEVGSLASRDEVATALATFTAACSASGEQFRACGITVRKPDGRRLKVAGVEPAAPFSALRNALKKASKKKKKDENNPKDGDLHISLGWYQLWSAANPEQKKETDKSLRPAIEELKTALLRHGNELPLMMPHLSNYPNMASFPRNVPDCGGGGETGVFKGNCPPTASAATAAGISIAALAGLAAVAIANFV